MASGGSGWPGYTAISSAKGASVARMRPPRTTMPCSVSATLCRGTGFSAKDVSLARSIVGWTMVWVRQMSSRASWRWKAWRLATPSSLRPSGPSQAPRSPAKPAKVTFM